MFTTCFFPDIWKCCRSTNNDKEYWGSISGFNMSTSKKYKSSAFCRPNMACDSPVYLMTLAEIDHIARLNREYLKARFSE